MKFTLFTNDHSVKHILIYLYEKNKHLGDALPGELYHNQNIGNISFIDWENSCDIAFIGIGDTPEPIIVKDQEIDITIQVNYYVNDRKMLHSYDFRNVDFTRQVVISGDFDDKYIVELIKKSTDFVEKKIKSLLSEKPNAIKKYIYNAEDAYWDLMNSTIMRSYDSLFLKGKEKEKLFEYVKDFFSEDTKKDYEKYNIPYKCNVLLYGKPGTGKTSTILTIASYMNMNIGIIPVSKGLDDMTLVHAMNSVKKNSCKIIVLEDVDCLFTDRKTHDTTKNSLTLSGLLNCLDGLFRNDGIMVFLTANNISFIDDAMLRSSRIDYKLYYDYAEESQIKACFDFYFPSTDGKEGYRKFYERFSCREITISMLQEFFFKHRKTANICEHFDEFDIIVNGIKEDTKDSIRTMYM